MTPRLEAWIEGIGVLGPGIANWPAAAAILAGRQSYQAQKTLLPAPALLPPAERRRAGAMIKLTLATGLEAIAAAGQDAAGLSTVFAASGGDGETCHLICEALASDDRLISPTRFHNSVHNAAAGYWSIATGAMAPAAVLSAHDASFSAGLLEAVTLVRVDEPRTVLLACDTSYPEPLHHARPIADALGIALVLAAEHSERALAKIAISLSASAADRFDDPELERLRLGIPAARGLPLLRALALRSNGPVVLDYLDPTRLAVEVTPC